MRLTWTLVCAGLLYLQPVASSARAEDCANTTGVDCGGVSCVVVHIDVSIRWPCHGGWHIACNPGFQTVGWPEVYAAKQLAFRDYGCADCPIPGACYMWPIVSGLEEDFVDYVDPVTGSPMHSAWGTGWVAAACTTCDDAGAAVQIGTWEIPD